MRITEFVWIWFATATLFLVSAVIAPGSVGAASLMGVVLPFAAILAIASVGQTLVIQQRGLDLSVPGILSMAAIVVGMLTTQGRPLVLAIVIACLLGLLAGALNGFLVAKTSITPLVATLASNSLFLGVVYQVSKGFPSSAAPSLRPWPPIRSF